MPSCLLPSYPCLHSFVLRGGLRRSQGPVSPAIIPLIPALFPQREEAAAVLPRQAHGISPMRSVLLTLVALAGVAGLLVALAVALCMRHHSRQRDKERLAALGPEGAHGDTTFEYQV